MGGASSSTLDFDEGQRALLFRGEARGAAPMPIGAHATAARARRALAQGVRAGTLAWPGAHCCARAPAHSRMAAQALMGAHVPAPLIRPRYPRPRRPVLHQPTAPTTPTPHPPPSCPWQATSRPRSTAALPAFAHCRGAAGRRSGAAAACGWWCGATGRPTSSISRCGVKWGVIGGIRTHAQGIEYSGRAPACVRRTRGPAHAPLPARWTNLACCPMLQSTPCGNHPPPPHRLTAADG